MKTYLDGLATVSPYTSVQAGQQILIDAEVKRQSEFFADALRRLQKAVDNLAAVDAPDQTTRNREGVVLTSTYSEVRIETIREAEAAVLHLDGAITAFANGGSFKSFESALNGTRSKARPAS